MKKDELVKTYMAKLGISKEEALQLIEDDAEDFIGDEGEEMTEKAKATNAKERVEGAKKKRAPRERKVDAEKGEMLKNLIPVVESWGAEKLSVKTETELSFIYNGNSYTIKLTKHRPPKGDK
jgi:hypothetical protein